MFTGPTYYPSLYSSDGPVMYPWRTSLSIDKQSVTPIYLQIVNAISREIVAGRLASGQKVPGSRQLGDLLKVNRKTVVIAYDELMAQDWLEIVPARGTFVSRNLPVVQPQSGPMLPVRRALGASSIFSFPTVAPTISTSSSLLRITDGSPDVRLAPVAQLYQRCKSVSTESPRCEPLRYGDDQGEAGLRHTLARYLRETRGLACTSNQILITRGSQMGIYLFLRLLLQPGERVVVGETSYGATNQVIAHCQGQLLTVPVDAQGLDTEAVATLCERHPIRALYVTSHHHYPTTVTLSAERRVRLLQLAQQYRFAIIEDDYDYDFHYASSPLLPLASLDTQGTVVYVGSFTKCIAPAVRIGYVVASENIIQSMAAYRRTVDRQGNPVLERALAGWIEDGELQRHLKKSLKVYRQRRDFFCALLNDQLGEWVRFRIPDGGMAVWVVFSPSVNLSVLEEYVRSQGISLDGVAQWRAYQGVRLGFASLNEEEMVQSVTVLRAGIER